MLYVVERKEKVDAGVVLYEFRQLIADFRDGNLFQDLTIRKLDDSSGIVSMAVAPSFASS